MGSWRDGVAREIPMHLPGDLLGWVEDGWKAFTESTSGAQCAHAELELIEARVRRLEPYRARERVHLLDAWRVDVVPPFSICLLIGSYEAMGVGVGGIPQQWTDFADRLGGLFELPSPAGEALFRPETMVDKLSELLRRTEVDFDESPAFSKRYFVPASDEAKLRQAMSKEVLDHIATHRGLTVDILDRDMLVAWPEGISKRTVLEAVPFFTELARFIPAPSVSPYR